MYVYLLCAMSISVITGYYSYILVVARKRNKKLSPLNKSKAMVSSLDLLHQHTLASVPIKSDEESSTDSGGHNRGRVTLPDGCIKAVEALCEKFK